VRLFDQRAHQHASHRLLLRSRHSGGEWRLGPRGGRRIQPDRLRGIGLLCDRYNPRILLFWYYSLRGLSLMVVPFTQFDVVSLSLFSIFYGLDWVATGPATFALTNEVFGRKDTPVVISWIFAGHQVGGALAAFGAGAVRSATGDYFLAFVTSGLACLLASLLYCGSPAQRWRLRGGVAGEGGVRNVVRGQSGAVTGAQQGIGRAMAVEFAAPGPMSR